MRACRDADMRKRLYVDLGSSAEAAAEAQVRKIRVIGAYSPDAAPLWFTQAQAVTNSKLDQLAKRLDMVAAVTLNAQAIERNKANWERGNASAIAPLYREHNDLGDHLPPVIGAPEAETAHHWSPAASEDVPGIGDPVALPASVQSWGDIPRMRHQALDKMARLLNNHFDIKGEDDLKQRRIKFFNVLKGCYRI